MSRRVGLFWEEETCGEGNGYGGYGGYGGGSESGVGVRWGLWRRDSRGSADKGGGGSAQREGEGFERKGFGV